MSFLFRKGKRGSKKSRNRSLPISVINDKDGKPNLDYTRGKPRDVERERPPSAKQANESLVTKINEEPANPIPDVIASHEASRDNTVSKNHLSMENRSQESTEKARGGINPEIQLRGVRHELSISQVDGGVTKVKERTEFAESIGGHSNTVPSPFERVEDGKALVHRPFTDDSFENVTTGSLQTDEADMDFNQEPNFLNNAYRKKRASSITHSEKEAVGTLDDVLRVFDDVDDNLEEFTANDGKNVDGEPEISGFDTYETVADIKKSFVGRDKTDPNSERVNPNSNNTPKPTVGEQNHLQNHLQNLELPIHIEDVYAKPIKSDKSPTPKKSTSPREIQEEVKEDPPPIPDKRFVDEDHDHEIKFSPLKKSSPSRALSKSLNKTSWANANENTSPNRKSVHNCNDNFSLKRGQLSGPAPVSTDGSYVEPPRDYDINASLSSIESISRDTWGSMTSSSTGGSHKNEKEFRPEAMKLIDKAKATKKETREKRQHDGLVNRSFRLIREVSLKETSKPSTKEDAKNPSDIEENYATIKNNADLWLEGYERMRASSEGKKESTLKSNSSNATNAENKQNNNNVSNNSDNRDLISAKDDNNVCLNTTLPLTETTQTVLNQSGGSGNVQIINGTSATVARSKEKETEKAEAGKIKFKEHKQLPQNDKDDSSDDENLIHLMETGISTEDSTESAVIEPKPLGYVPRALRMNFGQSWEGIRKDRREWKSREMKQLTAHTSRKGGKTLSNRLDEQEAQPEMLF